MVPVESAEQDTTEYLLSTEANRRHLFQALKDLENRASYIYVSFEDLETLLYNVSGFHTRNRDGRGDIEL